VGEGSVTGNPGGQRPASAAGDRGVPPTTGALRRRPD
jgi:hypothetical protein